MTVINNQVINLRLTVYRQHICYFYIYYSKHSKKVKLYVVPVQCCSPYRLFILLNGGLKIMVRFAAGVNMHHAVLNFRKLFFYLLVNVFGNGVCFNKG